MEKNTNRRPARKRRPVNQPRREETVYTEAKPVNITRFLIRIATVVAIVIAVVFGMSIFFKVDKVEIAGAEKYTADQVYEASGIMKGTNLLTLNKGRVAGRLLAELPYIYEVRIGIRLPDTVIIEVQETAVAYSVQSADESWWLISHEGKVLEKIDAAASRNQTRILGVMLDAPVVGETAVAKEAEGEEVPVVYNRERLAAALQIAKEMENNGVLGLLASIDVTDMQNITAWYGQRYEIRLGAGTELPRKIFLVVQVINQEGKYQTGILDASFTVWQEVYHKSFD